MNWMEFLKPTWKTGLVFVILSVVLPPIILYILFGGCYASSGYRNTGCGMPFDYTSWQIFGGLILSMISQGIIKVEPVFFLIPGIGILLSYLLACLFIYICTKIGKKTVS